MLLLLSNYYILIVTPLIFLVQSYEAVTHPVKYEKPGEATGSLLVFFILILAWWFAFRAHKAISGSIESINFKKFTRTGFIVLKVVMIILYISWFFLNFYLLGGTYISWVAIVPSALFAVYPFHLLGLINFIRKNNLYSEKWV